MDVVLLQRKGKPTTMTTTKKTATKKAKKAVTPKAAKAFGEKAAKAAVKKLDTAKAAAARSAKRATAKKTAEPKANKGATILALIQREGGATASELQQASGWQAHSVRGFISGALGTKMGLKIDSTKRDDGERVYSLR